MFYILALVYLVINDFALKMVWKKVDDQTLSGFEALGLLPWAAFNVYIFGLGLQAAFS